jgi:hypothetical protein
VATEGENQNDTGKRRRMVKAIAFKEWLKIRWTYLAMVLVCAGVTVNIALDLGHLMTLEKATNVWSYVILMQYPFYSSLRYVPLLVGIAVAVAQFVPEVLQARLKLSLHLPLRENLVLLWMVAYGGAMVAALLCVTLVAMIIVTFRVFPWEVVRSMVLTAAPWFAAGIVSYFLAATIVVEPRWIRRAFLIFLAYGFLDAFVLQMGIEAYQPSLLWFVVLGALTVPGVVLSGHRFRKGVR